MDLTPENRKTGRKLTIQFKKKKSQNKFEITEINSKQLFI